MLGKVYFRRLNAGHYLQDRGSCKISFHFQDGGASMRRRLRQSSFLAYKYNGPGHRQLGGTEIIERHIDPRYVERDLGRWKTGDAPKFPIQSKIWQGTGECGWLACRATGV
jgi:hypothetical protein